MLQQYIRPVDVAVDTFVHLFPFFKDSEQLDEVTWKHEGSSLHELSDININRAPRPESDANHIVCTSERKIFN